MSVVPYLTIPDNRGNEAADFYKKLFDAQEGVRMPAEDGKRLMHCELNFAGNAIYLSDNMMGRSGNSEMTSVFIGFDKAAEVDALAAKAKAMGATIVQEPQDMFWGDRFAMFNDPFGHRWQVGAPKAG
jgi:PhnB protein